MAKPKKSVRFACPPPPGTTDLDVSNREYEYSSPLAAADQEYTNHRQTYQQQPYNSHKYSKRKQPPFNKISLPAVAAATAPTVSTAVAPNVSATIATSTSEAPSGPGFYLDTKRPLKRNAGKCDRFGRGGLRSVFDDVVVCFRRSRSRFRSS